MEAEEQARTLALIHPLPPTHPPTHRFSSHPPTHLPNPLAYSSAFESPRSPLPSYVYKSSSLTHPPTHPIGEGG